MRVIILGSAAGGGVPQWNCGCPNCTDARNGGGSRTQSSVAVSADLQRWILLNASPDLRTQLAAHRALWPTSPRGTPVRAVILTDGEIDHTLGLLLMRESATTLPVYAPAGVTALLAEQWPLYPVLSAYAGVEPRALEDGRAIALKDLAGAPLGISCSATAVARRPPRYARAAPAAPAAPAALAALAAPAVVTAPAATFDVGLRLTDERTGGTLAYVPTAGALDEAVRRVASRADLLLFDGTFWSDDELRAAGGGVDATPTAREMGHLPVGGPRGSLELLPQLGAKRTVLVHINNTNPILCRSSAERARVEAAGIVVGEDAMEFEL
jgi:pyrroloquinoline quinone biosynthesis protein B